MLLKAREFAPLKGDLLEAFWLWRYS